MSPIFASLGSNYTPSLVGLALLQIFFPIKENQTQLSHKLAALFGGQVKLTYKGRDAIECALKAVGVMQGETVLTQAFCCSAIEEAIIRTGGEPLYADLAVDSLTPTVESLTAAWEQAKIKPKFLLLQHTLGTVGPVEEIYAWAKNKSILIIEDLAQCFGAVHQDGSLIGTKAAAVVLSFGRDKILDAVSGGAVVLRIDSAAEIRLPYLAHKLMQIKDMTYPLITWMIRLTHQIGLGKGIHWLCKKTGWMQSPTLAETEVASLQPPEYAPLVLEQFRQLENQLFHRQEIASVYYQELRDLSQLKILTNTSEIELGSNLRFPIQVSNPANLLSSLEKKGWHLKDRWYRQPVDGGVGFVSTQYVPRSCPQAEIFSQTCLNLPTHRYVSVAAAKQLCNLLKEILHD